MWSSSIFARRSSAALARSAKPTRRGRPALRLEALEERTLPSLFGAGATFAAGSVPFSVAIGDFNNDEKIDIAVANVSSANVSVLLGKGDGTFQTAQNFAAGSKPKSVAVADINGDGSADLAVANYGSANVSVLLGKGDGTFQTAQNFAAGTKPTSVTIGDMNGDGKPDLAVANQGTNNVSILLGKGDGTFQSAQNFAVGSFPLSVAIGDFNGDDKADLALIGGGEVSVLLGKGDGTFQIAQNFAAGSNPESVAVGDIDGDGSADLAVANYGSANVSVLLGKGDGTFQTAKNSAAKANPESVVIGDFNGDGNADLATANFSGNNVSVLLGNGDGTLQAAQTFGVGSNPPSVAIGDFNGDGKADLASANESNNVSVLLNSLAGTTTLLHASVNPPVAGQSITLTATVKAEILGLGSPGGTVVFQDGDTVLGTASLQGGAAHLSVALPAGFHELTAAYGGDNLSFFLSSGSLSLVVRKAASASALVSSASTALLDQPVAFTLTVGAAAPGGGTPTGSVTFTIDGLVQGAASLSGGSAGFTTALVHGNHTIAALYSGDDNFTVSSANVSVVVNQAQTSTTLRADVNPPVAGQPITLTATVVSDPLGQGTPTGTVTFEDGNTVLGTASLQGGVAQMPVSLPAGIHELTAGYGGVNNVFLASSGNLSLVVRKAASTSALASSVATALIDQPVTFTVTVGATAPGGGTPTGGVTFTVDGLVQGAASLSGGSTALTTRLGTGTHTIAALYSGDDNFTASSANVSVVVSQAQTSTTLQADVNPPVAGQPITLTATVLSDPLGQGTTTGTVTFQDGNTVLGTTNLQGGVAQMPVSLPAGVHELTAGYGGVSNVFLSSGGNLSLVVRKAASTSALASSAATALINQPVTFTLTVGATAPGGGTPTGSVTFTVDGLVQGAASLSGGSTALTTRLGTGTHTIAALYSGDHDFTASSTSFSQAVSTSAFFDDFHTSGPDFGLDSFWAIRTGSFSTLGGAARGLAQTNLATVRGLLFTDTMVHADLKMAAGQQAGLVARDTGSNYYLGRLVATSSGFQAQILLKLNGKLRTLKLGTTVKSASGTLKFQVKGNVLQLFLGGTLLAQVSDSTLKSGSDGICVGGGASLGNFTAE
jgi:hypothetical protein